MNVIIKSLSDNFQVVGAKLRSIMEDWYMGQTYNTDIAVGIAIIGTVLLIHDAYSQRRNRLLKSR